MEWLSSSYSSYNRQYSQHSRQQSSWLGRVVWFVFLFVFLSFGFSSFLFSQDVINDSSLQAWYKFEDSDSMLVDSSGKNIDLSIYNRGTAENPIYDTPFSSSNSIRGEGSAYFGGSNYKGTYRINGFGAYIDNSYSISFWMKSNNTEANTVVFRLMSSSDATGFILQGSNDLVFYHWISSWQTGPKFEGVLDNNWHHCVVVVDDEHIKLYKDGVLQNEQTNSGLRSISDSAWLALGSETRFHYTGNLDDVRIYNRALVADDITAIYNNSDLVNLSPDSTTPSILKDNNDVFKIDILV